MSWIEPAFLWTLGVGILSAGIGYGDLLLRSKTNAQRIEQIEEKADKEISSVKRSIEQLREAQQEHRAETTDRLARIETKLDQILAKR